MYGLLLINMQDYVTKVFGAKQYEEVREALKIKDVSITSVLSNAVNGFFLILIIIIHHHQESFGAYDQFPEGQLIKMGKKSMQIFGIKV